MKSVMLGMLAETSIHPGSGRGMGVLDLPVAREAATDYPVLVGSGLKGALRDKMRSMASGGDADRSFGKPDEAGALLISDGRLLLLPVRSLTGSYRWATCPHLIERYRRDLARAGLGPIPDIPNVERGQVLTRGDGAIFLEERQFSVAGPPDEGLAQSIAQLIPHPDTRERVSGQIAALSDDDFAWFARYGLSVQARNVLKDGTKKSSNLWYEETLPPDTLMYALIIERTAAALDALDTLFPNGDSPDPYLQVGGNETVGQGWFAVSVRRPEEDAQ